MSLAALLKQDSSFIPSRCKRDAVSAPSQPQENQRFCVGRDDRTGDSSRNLSPAPPRSLHPALGEAEGHFRSGFSLLRGQGLHQKASDNPPFIAS